MFDNKLPIAEVFNSIQGEGYWVGTPMRFIRLAGCPVGSKATQELVTRIGNPLPIPSFESNPDKRASYCKTWDGRSFVCDTDFGCHQSFSVDELLSNLTQKHICLTGGEPLIHGRKLVELGFFQQCLQKKIIIHIETSGTVLLPTPYELRDDRIWVTVAPKWNYKEEMIMRADEIKFLVDEEFNVNKVSEILQWVSLTSSEQHIFLCPINAETFNNQDNIKHCMEFLEKHPTWRLSVQLHKFLGLR